MSHYLERFALYSPFIADAPARGLFSVIVIPSYNEPELFLTLQSLSECEPASCPAEVIVVINYPEHAGEDVMKKSEADYISVMKFSEQHSTPLFRIHCIKVAMKAKDAGVGLARKIGMDEAVRRLDAAGNDGVIICLDADCTVSENYLCAVERHFLEHEKTNGASIRFEHVYETLDLKEREAIVKYELFLRYYVNGLRYAKHPFAYHTIGSSMAVRKSAYCKQGGMNKRKAGEDFYFLQKIFLLGNFVEINDCAVYPAGRKSDRVPFGTGRAVGDFLSGKEILFYDPRVFDELKVLTDVVGNASDIKDLGMSLFGRSALAPFLELCFFDRRMEEIRSNVANRAQFVKRFFAWFDGFMCLKAVHFLSESVYPRLPLNMVRHSDLYPGVGEEEPEALLTAYRKLDFIRGFQKFS